MNLRILVFTVALMPLAYAFGMWLGLDGRLMLRPSFQPVYAFALPATFLTCLRYQFHDGEVFANWDIEQPITFRGGPPDAPVKNVSIINNRFTKDSACSMGHE